MRLHYLDPFEPDEQFPPLNTALKQPDGLLAVGGCLTPQRLLNAYRHGAFPWYSEGEPILWWSPDPRLVLFPERVKFSRTLRKILRQQTFSVSYDTAFAEVIKACAELRNASQGTWITAEMQQAYLNLHRLGVAHSIETYSGGELVGGLYGVALGRVFFGESMFYRQSNASKVAFAHLVQLLNTWSYGLIDCQVRSEHLLSLGAEDISRAQFSQALDVLCMQSPSMDAWRLQNQQLIQQQAGWICPIDHY